MYAKWGRHSDECLALSTAQADRNKTCLYAMRWENMLKTTALSLTTCCWTTTSRKSLLKKSLFREQPAQKKSLLKRSQLKKPAQEKLLIP